MYCSTPASLSFTTSQSLLRFMSPVLMMISNHLILCCSPLFLTSIYPSIRVFSNELALHTRWQSIGASASVLPINIQGLYLLELTALISLCLRDYQESSPAPQSKSTGVQPSLWSSSHIYTSLLEIP